MPFFSYEGRRSDGSLVKGEREASSREALSEILIKENIIPISIENLNNNTSFIKKIKRLLERKTVPLTELSLFTRQMYTLTKSGVPISTGMKYLANASNHTHFAKTLLGISQKLESGKNLAAAMAEYPDIFKPLTIAMIQIGQNTGQLDKAFLRLSEYLELESSTLKRVKTSMRYPILVISAIIIGMIIINLFVIPAFGRVYARSNMKLPWITEFLVNISNFILSYWYLIISAMVVIVVLIYRYIKTPEGRFKWDKLKLRLPLFGFLIQRLVLLRFSESFAIVVNAGIQINDGLSLVADSLDNTYAKKEVLDMKLAIQRGSSIYKAAVNCKLFTGLDLQMLSLSEETGELGPMLAEIALYYEREIDYDLKHLIDSIEPIMLTAVAFMVLFLALAVYMPIWSMVKLVK